MRYEMTFYKDQQIQKTIEVKGFANAVKFAARELSKKMEEFIADKRDVRCDVLYLCDHEWSAVVYFGDYEVFGIRVGRAT